MELPVTAPVVHCAMKGIERSHVPAETSRRVRLLVPFGILLKGETLIPIMWSGWEGVVSVFVPKLLSTSTIGRDVRRGLRGGGLGILPGAG